MTRRRTLQGGPTLVALSFLFFYCIAGTPAAAQIFHDDWTATPADSFPDSVKVLNGAAVLGMHGGQRVIRVLPTGRKFNWTVLEFRLNDMLPQDFTIEFDLHAPLSTSYPLEIRAGLQGDPLAYLGATARANRVVANCGAVQTGIYGNLQTTLTEKQDRWDTTGVHRCRVAVTGSRMEVSYHNVSLAKDGVDFKRSRRLVMVVPATAGMEAHIGPLTISGTSSAAGAFNGQSSHTFIVTVVEGNPGTMQVQMTPAAAGITDTGARPVEGGNITVHR